MFIATATTTDAVVYSDGELTTQSMTPAQAEAILGPAKTRWLAERIAQLGAPERRRLIATWSEADQYSTDLTATIVLAVTLAREAAR